MLVYRRVTPSPPPSRMLAVPFYTPVWRESQRSKVPCLLKERTRQARLEPQTSISVVWGVNCSATHHTSCLSIPSAGTKERKIPYPTAVHPIPWRSCLDLYSALTTPMRWVWLKTFFSQVDFTSRLSGESFVGAGGGGAAAALPTLFLDQTEDQKVEKKFFETAPPPLSQGLNDRPLPTLSEGQGPSCSKGV